MYGMYNWLVASNNKLITDTQTHNSTHLYIYIYLNIHHAWGWYPTDHLKRMGYNHRMCRTAQLGARSYLWIVSGVGMRSGWRMAAWHGKMWPTSAQLYIYTEISKTFTISKQKSRKLQKQLMAAQCFSGSVKTIRAENVRLIGKSPRPKRKEKGWAVTGPRSASAADSPSWQASNMLKLSRRGRWGRSTWGLRCGEYGQYFMGRYISVVGIRLVDGASWSSNYDSLLIIYLQPAAPPRIHFLMGLRYTPWQPPSDCLALEITVAVTNAVNAL